MSVRLMLRGIKALYKLHVSTLYSRMLCCVNVSHLFLEEILTYPEKLFF